MTFYKKTSMIPKLTSADNRIDSSVDHGFQSWWNTEKMILTPDSSNLHGSLLHPSAPESPMSCISSHSSSRPSSVAQSCLSGMSSPYHTAQVPQMVPNMPTMDSTVSSARPEPDLNIGTILNYIFFFILVCKNKKLVPHFFISLCHLNLRTNFLFSPLYLLIN